MNQQPTNWIPGIIALVGAVSAAIVFLVASMRKHTPTPQPKSAADLEERYQALIRQLKEHAASKHLVSADVWAAENSRLEQAAAAVLREKAGVQHEADKAAARAAKKASVVDNSFFGRNPALKGAAWATGVIGFFVLLGVVLTQESTARVDGEMTGKNPNAEAGMGGRPPMQQGPTPEEQKAAVLMDRAKRAPDDVEIVSAAANELIKQQRFEEAAPLVRQATALDPFHVRTRVHRSILTALDGQTVTALEELEHLADTYDEAYDARLYAGAMALQANDPKRALVQFEKYQAEAPNEEQPPMLARGIQELRQSVAVPPALKP